MIEGVRMKVDHVSIAVRSIDRAYEWFRRYFPVASRNPKRGDVQQSGSFNWQDFRLGGFVIELIEGLPAKPGFVQRFIEKHGEGLHHLSLEVENLGAIVRALRRDGVRVVDEQRFADGTATAFISPRSAFGALVQFWEPAEFDAAPPAPQPDGLARFDHVSLAVSDVRRAYEFFLRYFPAKVLHGPRLVSSGGGFIVGHVDVGGVKLEFLQGAGVATESDFIGRSIAELGEGLHHIAITVREFDATLDKLRADRIGVVQATPDRPRGGRRFFVSPSAAFGTLIQVRNGM